MASLQRFLFLSLILHSILSLNHIVRCDDDEDLFQGINRYRSSLNLTTLVKNEKAECLAEQMSDQFKDQPCTNTTGANTVPGTEPQFANYPNLLAKCDLNVTTTRDGAVLPACVPGLVPSLVLSNFTQSQYSDYLNDTKFTGVGIDSEDDWIVVVLTTGSSGGDFAPAINSGGAVSGLGLSCWRLFFLMGFFLLL